MRLLKEPLLHFLVIGTALFGMYTWKNRGAGETNPVIQVRISEGDVLWLMKTWTQQWHREPTCEELCGLVTEFLKEELLAREAREMGLDENDTIVRRRLAQKLEFLILDTSRFAEPTDDDLRRFYEKNLESFRDASKISFTHIYFNCDQRTDAEVDAKVALAELSHSNAPAKITDMGDRLLIDSEFQNVDEQTVSVQFGKDFAHTVFTIKQGEWQGPIESSYGLHLVRVSEMKPFRQRELAEVRTRVLDLWREQRQHEDKERYFTGLLKKYNVVIDERVKPLIGSLIWPLNSSPTGK